MAVPVPTFATPARVPSERRVNGVEWGGGMTGARNTDQQEGNGEPGESKQERINRELIELLNELRVALPGVQFLFAFLLVVPFQQRVQQTTDFQKDVYFATLVAAVVATGLLIAPASQHRILFRKHDKEALLRRSSRSAVAGRRTLDGPYGSGSKAGVARWKAA